MGNMKDTLVRVRMYIHDELTKYKNKDKTYMNVELGRKELAEEINNILKGDD
tara:strand:+ start:410 stop:565 length:156 start_codon:yes stop_codon:yes gene_type:complete